LPEISGVEELNMMRFLRFTKTFIAAAAIGAACTFATPVAASADSWHHGHRVWLPFPPPPAFFFPPPPPRVVYRSDPYWYRYDRYDRHERWRDRRDERHERYDRHERHERHDRWR
jgi:hypothetical protein